ncbi:MAG: hypothetical protein V1886_04465 [archaeon]
MMESSDFVFNDCIKRIDYSPVRGKTERMLKRFSFIPFARRSLENKIKEIDTLQMLSDKAFHFWDWFFDEMKSQNLCRAKHNFYKEMDTIFLKHEDSHQIGIEGESYIEFEINGKPEFSISDDGKGRETTIPILEGSQPENLILYDYPKTDLPPFGKIYVEYKFDTRFYLGDYTEGLPFSFTDNPLKNKESDTEWRLFYGKPGCVYLRFDDRLEEELTKSVYPRHEEGKRFEMEGKIYSGNELFYQGNIDCTGTFPFFITKGKKRQRDAVKNPVPAGGALVKV